MCTGQVYTVALLLPLSMALTVTTGFGNLYFEAMILYHDCVSHRVMSLQHKDVFGVPWGPGCCSHFYGGVGTFSPASGDSMQLRLEGRVSSIKLERLYEDGK